MKHIPQAVTTLIEQLQKLPGIGPRSAERLTYYLLKNPKDQVDAFADAIHNLQIHTMRCRVCFNVSENDVCPICSDLHRNHAQILVVEDPLDMWAIEKADRYEGVYHVLGGVLDPIRGIGPDEIQISELHARIQGELNNNDTVEIIIATNPSTEGETTALYIRKIIVEWFGEGAVTITRIARGLPVGGDVEFADPITLRRAIEGRVGY